MSNGAYELKTANGYLYGEAVSALQKSIRRGLAKEALYWAVELNKQYPMGLWRRLVVIVCEDIGPANPGLVQTISNLYLAVEQIIKSSSKKDVPPGDKYDLAILGYAILQMAHSPKSREADDFVNEVLRERREGEMYLDIPDWALDQHTGRGKQMQRGIKHFWAEGARLANEAHPSAYLGYDPERGDGYHTADGKRSNPYALKHKPEEVAGRGGQMGMFEEERG